MDFENLSRACHARGTGDHEDNPIAAAAGDAVVAIERAAGTDAGNPGAEE